MYRKRTLEARIIRPLATMAFLATLLCLPSPAPVAASPLPSSCTQTLVATARKLGWPQTVAPRLDLPGRILQITNDDRAQEPAMWAAINLLDEADTSDPLDRLEEQGLARGLFHGWEAIIAHAGDPSSNLGELIAWRYGPGIFLAADTTGSGHETEIAEALYAAAVEYTVCAPSGSVVILAQTTDVPGHHPLSRFQSLAQDVERYYAVNGYGRVSFDLAFLDADGSRGSDDWYTLGPSSSAYPDDYSYAAAALQAALAGTNLPEIVCLERAIVIYGGESRQTNALSSAHTLWLSRDHYIEVQGAGHKTTIYVPNLVILSEEDNLGRWAHELGHTLHARHEEEGGVHRIDDRYDYPQPEWRFGHVGPWDLMGSGGRWGSPEGSSPTQMSSFTKVAAGWLCYRPAMPDHDYLLMAVENQRMGDTVLKLDDPLGDDPLCSYYLIEARDHEAPFGAPESGVMIYHVTYDRDAGHPMVNILRCQCDYALAFPRNATTLHGAAEPDGAREYTIPGGVVIRLLAESFFPYRATVRIEKMRKNRP